MKKVHLYKVVLKHGVAYGHGINGVSFDYFKYVDEESVKSLLG